VVSAGRLSPEKGHAVLLEAFATIAPQMPDVWLVLLGDGPEYRRLAALADCLGVSRRVLFAGYRKDIAAIFQVMDFLVLPSHTEGLPMVILEAFACGKPVVATTVGGVPEVVRQGETGLLIPEGDVAGLRRAMCAMLMDQPARERMGKGAYAWVRERFGMDRYVTEFAALFRGLINAPEPSGAAGDLPHQGREAYVRDRRDR
jgi:glycosyltransferase involved in cell wall biosynthesis